MPFSKLKELFKEKQIKGAPKIVFILGKASESSQYPEK